MGLVIVMIVGAIFGWLAAIVVDRDDRVGTAICTLAGTVGAVVGAIVAGNVPLIEGVSPAQLFWAALGALVAIVVINVAGVYRTLGREKFDNPAGQRHHRTRPY